MAGKQRAAKLMDVEPFVRRAFERAIIQIEPIAIDVGAHRPAYFRLKKQRPDRWRPGLAPCHRGDRGDMYISKYNTGGATVKWYK